MIYDVMFPDPVKPSHRTRLDGDPEVVVPDVVVREPPLGPVVVDPEQDLGANAPQQACLDAVGGTDVATARGLGCAWHSTGGLGCNGAFGHGDSEILTGGLADPDDGQWR